MAIGPFIGQRPEPLPPDLVDRLRRWVRTCLGLGEEETVTVTQLACREAGCAPVETVLAVLTPGAPVHRTIRRPADEVSLADVRSAFATVTPSQAVRSAP